MKNQKQFISSSQPQPESKSSVFADYARYYDLLYRDKNYAAEAEYVEGLIRKFHPSARSILDLGSGTGIHASPLAEKGFTVHGIERSPEMHARSQALAENRVAGHDRLTFTTGDIRDIRLNKRFDAVIALFHVISYQTTNDGCDGSIRNGRAAPESRRRLHLRRLVRPGCSDRAPLSQNQKEPGN